MKKVLIYGLKEPIGGMENIVKLYAENFDSQIVCDYVIFGDQFSFEADIVSRGGKVFYLPNRIKNRKAYRKKIKEIFQNNSYTAVWANLAGLTNIDFIKLGKKYGVPIRIAHSHGTRLYWKGALMRILVPLFHYKNKLVVKRYVTDFWACSELSGKFMFPKCVYNKIRIVNNAIDTSEFFPDKNIRKDTRKKLGIENNFVICHVARMSHEKNQSFMLDIFKELVSEDETSKLLFIGDGELKESLKKKVSDLGISNNVIFLGFKKRVADYYRASDIFLLPSISEGNPLTVIEAQACGLPCVVSNAIPSVANICGHVEFIPLDKPVDFWCKAIKELKYQFTENPIDAIKSSGYDISTEAKKISTFFLENKSAEI